MGHRAVHRAVLAEIAEIDIAPRRAASASTGAWAADRPRASVGPAGVVGYLPQRVTVDEAFVERARQGRSPEARFRFAEPCVAEGCANWAADAAGGGRCGVIDQVVHSPHARSAGDRPLPRCSIRARCQWFAQWPAQACASCPLVVHTPES